MIKVQIQIRNVYGEEKAYPVNTAAACIARIAGTKTLTRNSLVHVLAMGMMIVEIDRHGRACREYSARDASHLPMVA